MKELRLFLEYAATFLGNIGNYYVWLPFYPMPSIKSPNPYLAGCYLVSVYFE